jgi:predicted transcriptional regulator YdeE
MIQDIRIRVIPSLVLCAAFVFSARAQQMQDAMKPKATDQSEFQVIGIEARTNNAQEATGSGVIPKQWQRLFMEGILNQIPDRSDQSIAVVYTKYASDWNGDYTYILGAKVKPGTKAPEGMVPVTVPAGKYVEFESARGLGQEVVPQVWKQIWTYFQEPGNPSRAYKTDFELYEGPQDPNNVQAHIFIGLKP